MLLLSLNSSTLLCDLNNYTVVDTIKTNVISPLELNLKPEDALVDFIKLL